MGSPAARRIGGTRQRAAERIAQRIASQADAAQARERDHQCARRGGASTKVGAAGERVTMSAANAAAGRAAEPKAPAGIVLSEPRRWRPTSELSSTSSRSLPSMERPPVSRGWSCTVRYTCRSRRWRPREPAVVRAVAVRMSERPRSRGRCARHCCGSSGRPWTVVLSVIGCRHCDRRQAPTTSWAQEWPPHCSEHPARSQTKRTSVRDVRR